MFQQKRTIDFWATRELALFRRKLELQAAIDEIESAAATEFVDAEDTTDEQVLLAVANHASDSPTIEETAAWLAACEAVAVDAKHCGFGNHPRRVRISWNETGINLKESYIFCAALAQRQPDGESFVIASGTFKAIPQSTVGRDHQIAVEAPARGGWYRG